MSNTLSTVTNTVVRVRISLSLSYTHTPFSLSHTHTLSLSHTQYLSRTLCFSLLHSLTHCLSSKHAVVRVRIDNRLHRPRGLQSRRVDPGMPFDFLLGPRKVAQGQRHTQAETTPTSSTLHVRQLEARDLALGRSSPPVCTEAHILSQIARGHTHLSNSGTSSTVAPIVSNLWVPICPNEKFGIILPHSFAHLLSAEGSYLKG